MVSWWLPQTKSTHRWQLWEVEKERPVIQRKIKLPLFWAQYESTGATWERVSLLMILTHKKSLATQVHFKPLLVSCLLTCHCPKQFLYQAHSQGARSLLLLWEQWLECRLYITTTGSEELGLRIQTTTLVVLGRTLCVCLSLYTNSWILTIFYDSM
jgi:hypothetical protein